MFCRFDHTLFGAVETQPPWAWPEPPRRAGGSGLSLRCLTLPKSQAPCSAMKAHRRMLDLSRPLNVIASGTGTAVFRITVRRSTGAQVEAHDPEGAEPVGDSQNERPHDLLL